MTLHPNDFDINERCMCGGKLNPRQIIVKPKEDTFKLGCVCEDCQGYTGIDKPIRGSNG